MHRIYNRIPAHFYRVILHTETDDMTMALVPDQTFASLIAKLLNEHYIQQPHERVVISPTVLRAADIQVQAMDMQGVRQLELAIR